MRIQKIEIIKLIKKITSILIVLQIIGISSCANHSNIMIKQREDERIKLNGNSFGSYYLIDSTSKQTESVSPSLYLWTLLTGNQRDTNLYHKCYVSLRAVTKNRLECTLKSQYGTELEKKEIKVKEVNKHFDLAKRSKFKLMKVPLFWTFLHENISFGINMNDNLEVYREADGIIGFIVLPFFGGGGGNTYVYEKIKNEDSSNKSLQHDE